EHRPLICDPLGEKKEDWRGGDKTVARDYKRSKKLRAHNRVVCDMRSSCAANEITSSAGRTLHEMEPFVINRDLYNQYKCVCWFQSDIGLSAWAMGVRKAFAALTRRKPMKATGGGGMARVLSTLDLTALGVGSTLGVGVYVLAGFVSRLCYAEFGARVPRAGFAYVYSYVHRGGVPGLLYRLEPHPGVHIGAASVVRALSAYIDALIDSVISDAIKSVMVINVSYLAEYPDFFAFGLCLLFTCALAFGAKESSTLNNIFTVLNLSVVTYVIITGAFKADGANWRVDPDDPNIPEGANVGQGGFFPFGLGGMLKGAATCFYAFIGFDCVATTVFLAYFGVSAVLTLMWPYYLQHDKTPLPHVYSELGWPVAKWIVSVGAVFGLFSSLMGALYPLPRIIYAMSSDGLMFAFLGRIHARFQTPNDGNAVRPGPAGEHDGHWHAARLQHCRGLRHAAQSLVIDCEYLQHSENSDVLFISLRLCCFGAAACVVHALDGIKAAEAPLAVLVVFGCAMLLFVLIICLQPTNSQRLTFKVPLVPVLPAVSIAINIFLMMMLDKATWIRFAVWIVIGFAIYFGYSIWNSHERPSRKPSKASVYGGTDARPPSAELVAKVANT
ncbi:High affinity cationic amino acid transporter, partial [Gryllus bimaculatus]